MKKVINVEPGEVFKMFAEGKTVYCVFPDCDGLRNLRYESVYDVLDMVKDNKDRAFFIVEEEAET